MILEKITKSNVESALELIKLTSEQGLTDVSSIIYRSLESPIQSNELLIKLEDSLIKLSRLTSQDLFYDADSKHFTIEKRRYEEIEDVGTVVHRDINAKFELTDDSKKIKISSDFEGKTSKKHKTLELAVFLNINDCTISTLNQHMKIHDDLAKINPDLKTHSSFTPGISSNKFDYLDKDPLELTSYFNINDGSGAGFFQSQNNILIILPNNKFRLKHIDRELNSIEFSAEVEKIKKLSGLAKFVEGEFLKDSPGAQVTRMENPSNPLLPKILIQNGDHSYMINSESINIKNSSDQTIKTQTLEEFVSELSKPSPRISPEKNINQSDSASALTSTSASTLTP